MAAEKDYAVQFVAREQAELRAIDRDPTPSRRTKLRAAASSR